MKILAVIIFLSGHIAFGQEVGEKKLLFAGSSQDLSKNFIEISNQSTDPYKFFVNAAGNLTYSGGAGDFGLLMYKNPVYNFDLHLKLKVPGGDFFWANSGVFLRFENPLQDIADLVPAAHWPENWVATLEERTRGFLAEWTGVEVQLHSGREHFERPVNTRNGAFYGVPIGAKLNQQRHGEYRFNAGQEYEVLIRARGASFEVFMKWQYQDAFVKVSSLTFTNGARAHRPGFIAIQSYYNDGKQYRSLEFKEIILTKF